MSSFRTLVFALLLLSWGCDAAPTPHPATDATGVAPADVTPDPKYGELARLEETCASLGGAWNRDSARCGFDFSAANDADPDTMAIGSGEIPGPLVTAIDLTGESGAFSVTVELQATEDGCTDYVDWWEIVTPTGELVFRQVFEGPHEAGKPIEGTGSDVDFTDESLVIVRAHMSSTGYGDYALVGSPKLGFTTAQLTPDFAGMLSDEPPQPPACK